MAALPDLLQQGSAHAWLFLPSAVLLGVLHGLEPGHSKTMMAAFIIAVRGTVAQAVLLGLSAAASHTAVVWAVALAGLYLGGANLAGSVTPYLQLASGLIILAVAGWMTRQILREQQGGAAHDHAHDDDHGHDHDHHHHHHQDHDHTLAALHAGAGDAHARAHAADIAARFANREVTTAQVIVFGLTGGLIPCPAAITVLLLCLQLKRMALGLTLVLGFSAGLAITIVSVGVAAALGMRHARARIGGSFDWFAARAPFVSAALIAMVGLVMLYQGVTTLPRGI